MPLAAPLIPLFDLGAVLLAVGLIYGGRVPKVAAVVFALATVFPNAIPQEDSLIPAAIVGSAPMIAATSVFALAWSVRPEKAVSWCHPTSVRAER